MRGLPSNRSSRASALSEPTLPLFHPNVKGSEIVRIPDANVYRCEFLLTLYTY